MNAMQEAETGDGDEDGTGGMQQFIVFEMDKKANKNKQLHHAILIPINECSSQGWIVNSLCLKIPN